MTTIRKQLEAMPDGGVFAMSIPLAPYRCPPGPYERACQVADYFTKAKPKSKVLILDANDDVTSKPGLFKKAWTDRYKGIIEYRSKHNVTDVDVAGVRKKMKDKAFARGVNRDDIIQGAAALDIQLDAHIGLVLQAMQAEADALGLAGSEPPRSTPPLGAA